MSKIMLLTKEGEFYYAKDTMTGNIEHASTERKVFLDIVLDEAIILIIDESFKKKEA